MSTIRELKEQIDKGCMAQLDLLRPITIRGNIHQIGAVILIYRVPTGYTWCITASFIVPSPDVKEHMSTHLFTVWNDLLNTIDGVQTSSDHWKIVSQP